MKLSPKLLVIALAVSAIFLTTTVKAQINPAKAWIIGIGLETGIPEGNFNIGSKMTIGGTIRLQYGVSNNFAVTLTSGAYHFISRTNPATGTPYDSFGIIPVKIGFKEFFIKSLYFGAETGVGFEEDDSGAGPHRFILSPSLGWANKHIDIGVRYESFSETNGTDGLIGLRIAYGFGL